MPTGHAQELGAPRGSRRLDEAAPLYTKAGRYEIAAVSADSIPDSTKLTGGRSGSDENGGSGCLGEISRAPIAFLRPHHRGPWNGGSRERHSGNFVAGLALSGASASHGRKAPPSIHEGTWDYVSKLERPLQGLRSKEEIIGDTEAQELPHGDEPSTALDNFMTQRHR